MLLRLLVVAMIVRMIMPPIYVNMLTDTELARSYELDTNEWYVPLSVYTQEVDYTDVTVQVSKSRGIIHAHRSRTQALCRRAQVGFGFKAEEKGWKGWKGW